MDKVRATAYLNPQINEWLEQQAKESGLRLGTFLQMFISRKVREEMHKEEDNKKFVRSFTPGEHGPVDLG